MRKGRRLAITAWVTVPLGLVMLIGSVLYLRSAYTRITTVNQSMAPTYDRGEKLLVERLDGSEVHRGDVVLFKAPTFVDGSVMKRVVAVGGDRVACCTDQRLTLDGKPLAEPYVLDGIADGVNRRYEVTVPRGQLFLLGDNRADSVDSRFYGAGNKAGTVSADAVEGRVVDGLGGAAVWLAGAALGLVIAVVGVVCAIAARVVRRRAVPQLPPPSQPARV